MTSPTFRPDQIRRYFKTRLPDQRIGPGPQVNVECPFHDDQCASLSLNLEKGVWKCHASACPQAEGGGLVAFEQSRSGCDQKTAIRNIRAIVADGEILQRNSASTQEITYDYKDESGKQLYQLVRREPKQFKYRRPDGHGGWISGRGGIEPVLYNLPAVLAADVVLVAEGEKDADTLNALFQSKGLSRYAATTNSAGAGKWRSEYGKVLHGKIVFVFEDNDDPGRAHARDVLNSVFPSARKVSLIRLQGLPPKGDVTDWLESHTKADLFRVLKNAPPWQPGVDAADLERICGLMSLSELRSRSAPVRDWLWEGRLPMGTVSIIVSKPKVGKSTLVRNLVYAALKGKEFLGWPVKKGKVVYLALEECTEDLDSDLVALGVEDDQDLKVGVASTVKEVRMIAEKLRPVLLVVEPLFRLLKVKDASAYAEMYRKMGPLIDIARETGTHILCNHHSGKSVKADATDSPIGSTAIGGAVSTIIEMKNRNGHRTLTTVQRLGESLPETFLEFDPASKRLSRGGTRKEETIRDLEERILGALDLGESTRQELEEAVGGRTGNFRQAIQHLVDKGLISRSKTGKKGDPFVYRKVVPGGAKKRGNKHSDGGK